MSLDWAEVAVLAAAGFAASMVYGLTGFGAGLVSVSVATHFVSLPFALALYVLMDLGNGLWVGFEKPANAVRSEWTRLVPAILVGTAAGVTILLNLPLQAVTVALGVFVCLFAVYMLRSGGAQRVVSARWAWLAGVTGGITSSLFGAGGPPYAMYLSHRGLTKEQFRATMGLSTLASISLRAAAFVITGLLLDLRVWLYALFVVPAGLAGIWVASKVFARISRETLLRAVAAVLLASGVVLVAKALGR